jgi:hypothetical protein
MEHKKWSDNGAARGSRSPVTPRGNDMSTAVLLVVSAVALIVVGLALGGHPLWR